MQLQRIHAADQKWNCDILLPPNGLEEQISYTSEKVICPRLWSMPLPMLKHILRSERIKTTLTLTANMFIVCTFTDLIDWANKGQLWMVKGHRSSVLSDRLPLNHRPSFLFFCYFSLHHLSFLVFTLLSFLISSFLFSGSLSFPFPQLFSLYQTPSRIRAFLTCSAKKFEIGWYKN